MCSAKALILLGVAYLVAATPTGPPAKSVTVIPPISPVDPKKVEKAYKLWSLGEDIDQLLKIDQPMTEAAERGKHLADGARSQNHLSDAFTTFNETIEGMKSRFNVWHGSQWINDENKAKLLKMLEKEASNETIQSAVASSHGHHEQFFTGQVNFRSLQSEKNDLVGSLSYAASMWNMTFGSKLTEHQKQDVLAYLIYKNIQIFRQINVPLLSALKQDEEVYMHYLPPGTINHPNVKCGCKKETLTCSCCAHIHIPKTKIDGNGCVNLQYLPSDIGIKFSVTLDDRELFHETVSARNPPAICFTVPEVEIAKICIKFHDLNVADKVFDGCVKLEAKVFKIKVFSIELGCFHLDF